MFIVFNNNHLEALNLEETVFQNRMENNNIKKVRCKKDTFEGCKITKRRLA